MMPVTSGRTEWASKVVILLQLAVWSAVGITLIQKGMTSLREKSTPVVQKPTTNGITLEELSTISSQREIPTDDITKDTWNEEDWRLYENRNVLHDREPRNPSRDEETAESNVVFPDTRNDEINKINNHEERTNRAAYPNNRISKKMTKVEDNTVRSIDDSRMYPNGQTNSTDVVFGKEKMTNTEDEEEEYPADVSTLDANAADNASAAVARRNSKVIGGAAIAVAMLSVGAIMLLLGPAVVILRALEERRQRRRFLKLATMNDLPPSYEQATLMDEAPRYSTLRLNNT